MEWFKFTGEQDTRKAEVLASVEGVCCMNQMSELWVHGGCYTCCKAMLWVGKEDNSNMHAGDTSSEKIKALSCHVSSQVNIMYINKR